MTWLTRAAGTLVALALSAASATAQDYPTKNITLITYESNYGLRYIYLDGRLPLTAVTPDEVDRLLDAIAPA